ncbi:MAG: hypothetical protein F6J93_25160 [Oscillatoria sp. SIO1A7]|nr:hypothetical protein [Oscillatoria sp. SIO1A7]
MDFLHLLHCMYSLRLQGAALLVPDRQTKNLRNKFSTSPQATTVRAIALS